MEADPGAPPQSLPGEVLELLEKRLGCQPRLIGELKRFGLATGLSEGAPRWRIPAYERTGEKLKALMEGRSEAEDGRSELLRLAVRLIIAACDVVPAAIPNGFKPIFYSWSPVEVLKPAEIRHF